MRPHTAAERKSMDSLAQKQTFWVFSEYKFDAGDSFIRSEIFTTRNKALEYLSMRLWRFTGKTIDEMRDWCAKTDPTAAANNYEWYGACSRSAVHVKMTNSYGNHYDYYATVRSARVMTDTPPMLTREYESRRT